MVHTEQGQHYIELSERFSAELALLIVPGTPLWDQGFDTLDLTLPALESLLDGRAEETFITEGHVDVVVEFLNIVGVLAGPDLAQVIEEELQALPFEASIGQTMAQAQARMLGNGPFVAEAGGPYQVEVASQVLLAGSVWVWKWADLTPQRRCRGG